MAHKKWTWHYLSGIFCGLDRAEEYSYYYRGRLDIFFLPSNSPLHHRKGIDDTSYLG